MPETMCKFMNLSQNEYFEWFKEAKKEVENGITPDCDIFRIWCQKKYQNVEKILIIYEKIFL